MAAIAAAVAGGLDGGGVLPVLKHIPGHGRATADSHKSLPIVRTDRTALEATDFAAFRALATLPMAMTAHVVFTAIDALPVTTSKTMISNVIRGFIGFDGLLMSDDVSMGASTGSIGERTAATLAAGCDVVLHCNGKIEEMHEVAKITSARGRSAAPRRRCGSSAPGCRRGRSIRAMLGRSSPSSGSRLGPSSARSAGNVRHDCGNVRHSTPRSCAADRATDDPALIVDVEGFEGPLDLLLRLAREQKVDLAKISILALADQYLAFIEEARRLRLELAADYLVMAAWLAYLKSRLLLPEPAGPEGESAADLANALALRLKRLEAIRIARRPPD